MPAITIQLSDDQAARLLAWIRQINLAHHQEECVPPGFDLVVTFSGPFGEWAEARCGGNTLDLGDVQAVLPPDW